MLRLHVIPSMTFATSTLFTDQPATVRGPALEAPAEPSTLQLSRTPEQRLAHLDAMRLLAVAGVVWQHSASLLPVGAAYFAVPLFVVASVLLTARSLARHPEQSSGAYLARRVVRLYPAFLFWCFVYEAFRQSKWVLSGGPDALRLDPLRWIGGTYEHLWFLPFLLVATVCIVPLIRAALTRPRLRTISATIAFLIGVAWTLVPVPAAIATPNPDSRWDFLRPCWWALPSLMIGLTIALAMIGRRGGGLIVSRGVGVAGLILWIAATAVNWNLRTPNLAAATAAGVGALWLACSGLLPAAVGAVASLGRLALGVYLSHVIVLRMLVMFQERSGWEPSPAHEVLAFIAALTGGLVISWALARSRWTRWTIGL